MGEQAEQQIQDALDSLAEGYDEEDECTCETKGATGHEYGCPQTAVYGGSGA